MRYMLFAFAGRGSTRIGQIQKRAGNRTTEFGRASTYLDKAIDDAFAEGAKTNSRSCTGLSTQTREQWGVCSGGRGPSPLVELEQERS